MSSLLRPVGPLPGWVYWLRRLLVVVGVLLVAVVVWWLLRPSSSSVPGTTAILTTSPAPSTTPTPSPSATPAASGSPTGQGSSTGSTVPRCSSSDISVTVTTDASTYPPDRQPRFTLVVQNVGKTTCQRDVGSQALELVVSSGDTQVWSSDDCNPGGEVALRTFGPGDRYGQTVQWSRQQSSPGCPTDAPTAAPGSYQVVARDLGLRSEPAPFVLR